MARAERLLYRDRIVSDPGVLVGKPVVRGTRISVELVLDQLSDTLDLQDLYAAYPELTEDDVKAALAYARTVLVADARSREAARERRFRRALAVAKHDEIDGDALLEELEREDAAERARARA